MTLGSGLIPVQYCMPRTPWFTSIPSPSITRQPMRSASRINCVRGGLGITSATIMWGIKVVRLSGTRSLWLGYSPMLVALIKISVLVGRLISSLSLMNRVGVPVFRLSKLTRAFPRSMLRLMMVMLPAPQRASSTPMARAAPPAPSMTISSLLDRLLP